MTVKWVDSRLERDKEWNRTSFRRQFSKMRWEMVVMTRRRRGEGVRCRTDSQGKAERGF